MNRIKFNKPVIVLSALLFVSVLALIVVLYSFEGSGDEYVALDPLPPEEEVEDNRPKAKSFTMMVYMVGSDLESFDQAASSDLRQMIAGNLSDKLNVVLQTGGSTQWHTPQFVADWAQRWRLTQDGFEELGEQLPQLNMAEPDTLRDFVTFAATNYPADRYGLVFWNHGGGAVKGFGYDENFDMDALTLQELYAALNGATNDSGIAFEWIGFDACLMATVETAYMMSPFSRYMIASEELEPNHGWNYEPIVTALADDPSMSGAQLGDVIIDSYQQEAEAEGTETTITLSVLNLAYVDKLYHALEQWAQVVYNDMETNDAIAAIAKMRSDAESFGRGSEPEDNSDMTDIGDLVEKTEDAYPSESLAVSNWLGRVVVARTTSEIAPNATGLSIYFPYHDQANFEENLAVYDELGLPENYRALIRSFSQRIAANDEGIVLSDGELTMSVSPDDPDQSVVQFTIPKRQLNDVIQVYSVLGAFVDEDSQKTLLLGTDNNVSFDEGSGQVATQWNGRWVTLDGRFVTMHLVQTYEESNLYTIPASLNGDEVDLYVSYDIANGTYTILGAWKGVDNESGLVDRDVRPLENGDRIVPFLEMYDENSGDSSYVNGDKIVYEEGVTLLEAQMLPSGAYSLGFVIEDYAQNLTYTDFEVFEVE